MNTDGLSALTRIIAQGLGALSEGKRDTGIKSALGALFEDRYHSRHAPKDGFRDAYGLANDDGVAWAGLIAEENPPSGAYGGASIAWFPREGGSLMTFVVGTRGLAPDEGLLTRHGHRRRVAALRHRLSDLGATAWSKPGPAAISVDVPEAARRLFPACAPVFKRYGSVIYCAAWVGGLEPTTARAIVQAFFDLYAFERNWEVRVARHAEFDQFLVPLRNAVFPLVTAATVNELLREVDHAPAKAVEFFDRLTDVFIQHASDDMLDLLPGHSYYLSRDEAELKNALRLAALA